tara:strand:- start:139 stop:723 length:585 start_codon:yes stop_codon:yes gene_type:complete
MVFRLRITWAFLGLIAFSALAGELKPSPNAGASNNNGLNSSTQKSIAQKSSAPKNKESVLPASTDIALKYPQAFLEDSPDILYALPDLPVTEALDENGDSYRPVLLIAESIFDELGIKWQHVHLPVTRMYSYLNSGRAHFSNQKKFSVAVLPANMPCYAFILAYTESPMLRRLLRMKKWWVSHSLPWMITVMVR